MVYKDLRSLLVNFEDSGYRRFPGAAEKTLQGQSLESVSADGNGASLDAKEGGDDPLLWPGVRPLEIDPVNSLTSEAGGSRLHHLHHLAASSKKTTKSGVKGCSRDPGSMIVIWFYLSVLL